jgi:RNA polymerase sigma-70 factor (ECF subfamily)
MADAKVKISGTTAPLTEAALESYASALNRYLSRRLRRAQDVPDMVQEIFERFLRKRERPEVLRNPFGYLLGIARNVLCESLGNEQHNPVVYNSDLVDALVDSAEDASLEPLADRIGDQQEIVEALSKLPENHVIAIMLVDGQGMSYEEAAKASGFTKNTIATYVMHARASLRQILPGYWSDSSR